MNLIFSSFKVEFFYCNLFCFLGINPKTHQIIGENDRLRKAMARAKQISDRSLMPRLNKSAAQRFVRNGLWDPNERKEDDEIPESANTISEENWES